MVFYPLKFRRIIKKKLWGSESWELCDHGADASIINNGVFAGRSIEDVIKQYPQEILGSGVAKQYGRLPLLFKFIDAQDKLSIQVHPNDEYALKIENSFGKTEAWYIVSADSNAKIICGLKRVLSKEEVLNGIKNSTLEKELNELNVKAGECYFVPSGTVHAIESGLVIYEVQQVSDITYRLYDWGRVDEKGQPRELHIEKSLAAMNFNDTSSHKTEPLSCSKEWGICEVLAACKYFIEQRHIIVSAGQVDRTGSFTVVSCMDGEFIIKSLPETIKLTKGETVLIPAVINNYIYEPVTSKSIAISTEVPFESGQ